MLSDWIIGAMYNDELLTVNTTEEFTIEDPASDWVMDAEY
jgi:hypothetical protein